MITTVFADGKKEYEFIDYLKKRAQSSDKNVIPVVSEILDKVREHGDSAVRDYTIKFDGKAPEQAEISAGAIDSLIASCDRDYLETVKRAASNIADFHQRQVQQSWLTTKPNGVMMGQRVRGLKRVGIYVPGGTAAYPSSVLMNAIPAKIAGVQEIVMCTPPQKDGTPNPNIIAAAKLAGVDRIFLMGGAQAVAAMAYGTETVPKVDKIVGPGNIFVATAKKLLYGTVDIDMIAGPSEILIVADKTANPKFLAADLMSQAEHDKLASAILLTDSAALAEQTKAEIERQSAALVRKEIIDASLDNFGAIIVCSDIAQVIDFANELAPEHLEVCCANPMEYVGKLDNAGSVFLGNYCPEALGDYFAGPNHTLPTGGTARFSSPLAVEQYIKKSSVIQYSQAALAADAPAIIAIARHEGLWAHARSVELRQKQLQ